MNPVFPFSGRESGQRWRWTFAPRGATVTQWGNEVTTRKPIFSFHHFMAFFSFRTTTATVANFSMGAGNRARGISLRAVPEDPIRLDSLHEVVLDLHVPLD